ncbi:MAG: hypothetical protein IJX57_07675 [Clostridia bacterium]|nr:hypothetical protein [Clostridia bacterium]
MNCEKFNECLDNYENLTDAQKLDMTAHANECEKCRKELDFMLSIIATTASLPKIEPPADFMKNLNVLIDAEEKKRKRIANVIFTNVRRNWQQYTAAAACFALVAVITANSNMLLDNMNNDTDDVIPTQNYVIPISTEAPAEVVVPAEIPVEQPVIEQKVSVTENKIKPAKKAQPVKPQTQVSTENVSQPAEVAVQVTNEPVVVEQTEEVQDYGIATARIMHETSSEGYTMQGRSMDMPQMAAYNPEEIQAGYSLAEEGSIAHGAHTAAATAQPEKAIGKLKISAEDADEAMDVILLYSYGLNEEM